MVLLVRGTDRGRRGPETRGEETRRHLSGEWREEGASTQEREAGGVGAQCLVNGTR